MKTHASVIDTIERQMAGALMGGQGIDFLEEFINRFGARFGGSASEQQAALWLAERFESFNVPNVSLESFDTTTWLRKETSLTIISPQQETIPCIALPYCRSGEAEGPLVYLGDGHPKVFAERAAELDGAIVMVTTRSPAGLGRSMGRTEKIARAMQAGARAIIWMRDAPGGLPETGTANFGQGKPPIAVAVSYEAGHRLIRLARSGTLTMRVTSTNEIRPSTSSNVVAEFPGTTMPEEVIVIGAHYDGHDIGEGAMDNGAGTAALMEAVRALAPHQASLGRTVRFVAFAQEETGLRGAHQYALRHTAETIRFMLNHDAACRGIDALLKLHGWPENIPFAQELCQDMRDADIHVEDAMVLSMDSYPFLAQGIPCGTLMTRNETPGAGAGASRGYGHTSMDTFDKVIASFIQIDALRLARIALRLSIAEELPFRRKSIAEVRAALAQKGLEDILRFEGRPVPGDE